MKSARSVANTFAPRASGATGKNPAVKGSFLYDLFVGQAWISAALGGLLSFNILFPSDEPDVWRLVGCVRYGSFGIWRARFRTPLSATCFVST